MPEYLSPGVYIEEIEIGAKPIEGVSTSTLGIIGETERGPTLPKLVTSWLEYQRIFGSYFGKCKYLPYAVEGFFKNGGKRCYVARIIQSSATKASLTLKTDANLAALIIEAIGEGAFGKKIAVKTQKNGDQKTFKLIAYYWKNPPQELYDPLLNLKEDCNKPKPDVVEVYDRVSVDPISPDFYETKVNGVSNLIQITKPATAPAIPKDSTNGIPTLLAGDTGNESDPIVLSDYKREDPNVPHGQRKGLSGLAEIDEISLIYTPALIRVNGLYDALIAHCETLKDRFAIIDVEAGTPDPAKPGDTSYGAFYCPWINIVDSKTGLVVAIPPGGYIAGIYARSDLERGVHKAPANEVVLGADSLEYTFTKGKQDILNPKGVNCIRAFPGRGIRVWGARTMSDDSIWKYVNVRRLFIFLEKSIEKGTQWAVFEPNNEKLWARVKQTITQFLTTVWKNGALLGMTPEEAFFVKCDRTTMTQDDIDNGRLIVIIGVAPTKPAEFVIFRISQWQGGSSATE
jgi:uncharacterized protein